MAKLKIGDVVEIKTTKGLVYAHYTNKDSKWGSLLRVFQRFYDIRPEGLEDVVKGEPMFITFFPLSAAVKQDIVSIAGNVVVPPEAQAFPIFRNGVPDPVTRKIKVCWLWDGEKEWKVGELTPALRKLPILEVVNDTLLIERIESGWTSELFPPSF